LQLMHRLLHGLTLVSNLDRRDDSMIYSEGEVVPID
jgi:hypothetical protein